MEFDGNQYVRDAGQGFVDHIERIELLATTSMAPILRQVLDFELCLLAQMIYLMDLGPVKAITQCRVDSCAVQGSKKNA